MISVMAVDGTVAAVVVMMVSEVSAVVISAGSVDSLGTEEVREKV